MILADFIRLMPKVELHVHVLGAISSETLLKLARKNHVELPADTVDGLNRWYTYTDFAHFVEVYLQIADCIRTPDDIELITREFLIEQAAQNILYTEMTYTPYYATLKGITFSEQLEAINRATSWAQAELGVQMGWVIDIPREVTPDVGMMVAEWAGGAMHDGVIALGLGGPEIGNPPEKFSEAFAYAQKIGLPSVPHAGETVGAESIWGALRALNAVRIGHGVRCLEDPVLVTELHARQIPLEVCPTSNVCLHVAPDFAHHPLPKLLEAGLYVTLNSDDPAMFNTTLTDEFRLAAEHFNFDAALLEQLVMNAARAALLPPEQRESLIQKLTTRFAALRD
ncbi:MAG: adenosine deaminase [Chloroflexota bacterium]